MPSAFVRRLGALPLAACLASGCGSSSSPPAITIAYPPAAVNGICPVNGNNHIPRGSMADGQVLRVTALMPTMAAPFGGNLLCDALVPLSKGGLDVAFPNNVGPLNITVELYSQAAGGDAGGTPALLAYGRALGYDPAKSQPVTVALAPEAQFTCAQQPLRVARAFHTATALPNGQVLIAGGLIANADDKPQFASATAPNFLVTGSIEVYDPATQSSLDIADVTSKDIPRAFGAAYYLTSSTLPNGDVIYTVLLMDGITPKDPTQGVLSTADPTMPSGQPLRLWPNANATPAPAEIITYDATARTIQHSPLGFSSEQRMLGGNVRIEPKLPGPLDRIPVSVGVASTDPTTLSWTTPTFSAFPIDPSSGTPNQVGPYSTLSPHVGASILPIPGPAAIVWGGDLSAAHRVGEFLDGFSAGGTVAQCALNAVSGTSGPTAYQTVTMLDAPGTSPIHALAVGGFAIAPGMGTPLDDATAIAPDVADLLTVTYTGTPTCPTTTAPSVTAAAIPPGGLVGVGYHDAVLLPDGDVLIAGGVTDPSQCPGGAMSYLCSTSQAFLYHSTSPGTPGTLVPVAGGAGGGDAGGSGAGGLVVGRFGHRMTLLRNDTVLVTGGIRWVSSTDLEVVDSVETYGARVDGTEHFTVGSAEGGMTMATRVPGDVARDAATMMPVAPCTPAK